MDSQKVYEGREEELKWVETKDLCSSGSWRSLGGDGARTHHSQVGRQEQGRRKVTKLQIKAGGQRSEEAESDSSGPRTVLSNASTRSTDHGDHFVVLADDNGQEYIEAVGQEIRVPSGRITWTRSRILDSDDGIGSWSTARKPEF